MKRIIRWETTYKLLTLFSIAVACVWIFLVFCIALYFFFELKPGDMSGWVQAIGSIVAIGSAIGIAGDQTRREQARIKRDQRIVVLIVLDIAQRACAQIGKFRQQVTLATDKARRTHFDGVEGIGNISLELKGIDLTAIGNPNIVRALLRLRGACTEFLERIRNDDEQSFTRIFLSARSEYIPNANKIHEAALNLIDACAHPNQYE